MFWLIAPINAANLNLRYVIYQTMGTEDPDLDGTMPGLEGARYHIAKKLKTLDVDKTIKVYKVSGTNFKSEDVSVEVKEAIEEKVGHHATSVDRYDDPEYIRKRLGSPSGASYNPIIAKSYVQRLDSQRV